MPDSSVSQQMSGLGGSTVHHRDAIRTNTIGVDNGRGLWKSGLLRVPGAFGQHKKALPKLPHRSSPDQVTSQRRRHGHPKGNGPHPFLWVQETNTPSPPQRLSTWLPHPEGCRMWLQDTILASTLLAFRAILWLAFHFISLFLVLRF